jgi:DNA-directed RNA polymerase subunit E'/Rpb7
MNYSSTKTKNDIIILKPSELGNIKNCITNKLQEKIYTCSREDGYIIDIFNITSYNQNIISRTTSNCLFNVKYNAKVLKPEIGHIYSGIVNTIFPTGIFAEYENIKIFIPASELLTIGWIYTINNNTKSILSIIGLSCNSDTDIIESSFVNETSEDIILVGSSIQIKINMVKYDDGHYKCIGTIFSHTPATEML